jgi:hypothetical protein
MPDDFNFAGQEGEGRALLLETDTHTAWGIHPPPLTDSELPPQHSVNEDRPKAWLWYWIWNYRTVFMTLLCILYARCSQHRDRSGHPFSDASHRCTRWNWTWDAIQYGMNVFWNTLGTAGDDARALGERILESLRNAMALVGRPHTGDAAEDDDDDRETWRWHRWQYFFRSHRRPRTPSSLPDLDETDTGAAPFIIPETNRARTQRCDNGPYADPSLNDSQSSRRNPGGDREEYTSSKCIPGASAWKRGDHCVRPLEPAFGRPEDYPGTWYIYHPVLRVVTKETADAYDRQHPLVCPDGLLAPATNETVDHLQTMAPNRKSHAATPDLPVEMPFPCRSTVRSSVTADPVVVAGPLVVDAPDRKNPPLEVARRSVVAT